MLLSFSIGGDNTMSDVKQETPKTVAAAVLRKALASYLKKPNAAASADLTSAIENYRKAFIDSVLL